MTVFPDPESASTDEAEIQHLAAVRGAIHADRRAWRHDIIVSAVVEVLAGGSPSSLRSITLAVNRSFRTDTIAEALVDEALSAAYEANLVSSERDLSGDTMWRATDAATAESEQDRRYVRTVLGEFVAEVGTRLEAMDDDRLTEDRADKVAGHVYAAIGAAAAGMYALDAAIDIERLRPLEVKLAEIESYALTVNPQSVRRAVVELALAAMDPDDQFGNEVVRLITVGNLLHGFATRRDLPVKPDLTGHRILLDTSVLIDLADNGTPQQRLVVDLIKLSLALGVEVYVANHTIAEWERLWDAAVAEVNVAVLPDRIPANMHRLASNPFAGIWLRALEEDPTLTFDRFRHQRIEVRRILTELGVRIREHGNNRPSDRELAEAVRDHLLEQTGARNGRAARTRAGAIADGESCAMIARWRSEPAIGPTGAYFVANEYRTGQAYRELRGKEDRVPLLLNPATWLMYVASVGADDPAQRSQVAEIVSDATVRGTFFGMAIGYTLEEAVTLSEQLCNPESGLTIEDTRAAIQLNLLDLIEDVGDATAVRRGAAVVQRRNSRRQRRLVREERRVAKVEAEALRREAAADGKVDLVSLQLAEERKQKTDLEKDLAEERRLRARSDRNRNAFVVGLIAIAGVLMAAIGGWLHGVALALAVGLVLHLLVNLRSYVEQDGGKLSTVLWWGTGELAIVLIVDVAAGKL